MNRETAVNLLSNLLERAKVADEKTFLTTREITALEIVLLPPDDNSTATPPPDEVPPEEGMLLSLEISEDEIRNDAILCVDFGTSFSKAFASIDNGEPLPDIIDLPIGTQSGWSQPLITPSEMIVHQGAIYFGTKAREVFEAIEAGPERLIDSIKQYMTLGAEVSNLGQIRLDDKKDPDQRFYQRDVLVLYLAHLMRLAERALESRNIPVNIRRRFAHPAWDDANREANEREMKQMMAESVLLARSLGDRLLESLPVTSARKALDGLRKPGLSFPVNLIGEPVREATAAGAGALLGARKGTREAYIIVDIGAGTTDVAGCICVSNPEWDRARVFEISGAAKAIKSAGNILDNALVKALLAKSHLSQGSAEYQAAASRLNRYRRINKETLFTDGLVTVELPTQEIVDITLEEFLKCQPVINFTESIRKLIRDSAIVVAGDENRINFVATGGGARLPMVRAIADEGIEFEGKRVALTWRDAVPTGMAADYPDLIDPYPQIAVALGGALPELPEQRKSVATGLTTSPQYYIQTTYKS